MKKSISHAMAVFTVFAAWAFASAAHAQNQQLLAEPQIIKSMSVTEVVTIMQEAGLTAALVEEDAKYNKVIEVSLEGAGTIYVTLLICDGPGASAGCQLVQPYGLFDGSGVTLAQINDFNLQRSQTTIAGLLTSGDGLIGAKFYLVGGITRENFFNSMGLFFQDVDRITAAITPGTLAQLDYGSAERQAEGLVFAAEDLPGSFSSDRAWKVNVVGEKAPKFITEKTSKIFNLRIEER